MFYHSENHKELSGTVAGGHVEALLRRHADLEQRLATFKAEPAVRDEEIRALKRQKLRLMDEIAGHATTP